MCTVTVTEVGWAWGSVQIAPQPLNGLCLLEDSAGSSGSVPHQGSEGSRSLNCFFTDQLLSNVTGSGPLHSTHGDQVSLSSDVQDFLSIGSDWPGGLGEGRTREQAAKKL